MLRQLLTAFTTLLFVVAASPTAAADDVPDKTRAKVVKVESGEVVVVQLAGSKKRVKVRVIGIDCNGKSTSAASRMTKNTTVVLRSDKGFLPILEDQFGRYVAYVTLADGKDLGLEMLKTGTCSTAQWSMPHPKVSEYATASR